MANQSDTEPVTTSAGQATNRAIGILGGTGPEGRGLALRWARAGETVLIGSRDPQHAESCAAQVRQEVGAGARVDGLENAVAVAAAEIVVVTVPFEGHVSLLKKLKPAFKPGTIVIDTTVPLAASLGGRATRTLGVWEGSAAEQAAEILGTEIAVAAAFQNTSATLLNGDAPVDCDVIICSDDKRARQAASRLAEEIPGVRAVNGGNLENARIVEQFTALLIGINIRYNVHTAGLRLTGLPIPPPVG
ncbi:MAG: NADPH-dependent F420 reductase [Terriglobia bacterium]